MVDRNRIEKEVEEIGKRNFPLKNENIVFKKLLN